MKLRSVRFKIIVLYTMLLGLVLIAYSGILYSSLYFVIYNGIDQELKFKAQEVSGMALTYVNIFGRGRDSFIRSFTKIVSFELMKDGKDDIRELHNQWLGRAREYRLDWDYVALLDAEGRYLVRSKNVSSGIFKRLFEDIDKKVCIKRSGTHFCTIKSEGRRFRLISVPITPSGSDTYYIQIATLVTSILNVIQDRLYLVTKIGVIIFLPFAVLLGWRFSSSILVPLGRVTNTAKKITHEDFSVRVRAGHLDEEIKDLIDAFNDMVDRLEDSAKFLAEFNSHVAHELKTPLAIIRGELELALRKDRDREEYIRVINIALEENKRMRDTIEDLLLLTKLDYRPEVFKFEDFDFVEFFNAIGEQTRILASEKDISTSTDIKKESISVSANKLHLRRLFLNLVHNAIKYTKKGGSVKLEADVKDNNIVVTVSDTGVGIPEEDLPKIFKRFYHKDRTGYKNEPGHGLGLSIALSVAKVHKGRIEVRSKVGEGSVFTVILPLA